MNQFDRVTCQVNGSYFEPDRVGLYRTRPGDMIVLTPKLSAPLAAAVVGLGSVVASAASATSGALGVVGTFATKVAIMYGVNTAIGALMPKPKTPDFSMPSGSGGTGQQYTWNRQTLQQARIPKPLVFGRHKLTGNLIASHTEIIDNEEQLSALIGFGYGTWGGPVDGTLEINEQPSGHFPDIVTDYRRGTLAQTAFDGFDQAICEYEVKQKVTYSGGAYTWTTPYMDFDDLKILLWWRSRYINDASEYKSNPLGIKVELSVKDADSWTTLVDTEVSNDDNDWQKTTYEASGTYDGGSAVGITGSNAYDIRVTKTTEDVAADDSRHLNDLYLYYVQEVHDVGFRYVGQPLRTITALASEQLSGTINVSEQWECQVCEIYDGETWTIEYTNNPAWVIHYLITQPLISGDGTVENPYTVEYYRCVDPADIGNYSELLESLVELAARSDGQVTKEGGGTTNRYTFNGGFVQGTDVWTAIKAVCNVCNCELRPYGNGYKLYEDEPWAGEPVALFSAGNIIPDSFELYEVPDVDKVGDFLMEIKSEEHDFEAVPIPMYSETSLNLYKSEDVSDFGFTNATQAARKLYRMAKQNEIVNFVAVFRVAIDGLNCDLSDVVYLASPWRKDGRVTDYPGGAVVTLDRSPVRSADDTLILRTHIGATGYELVEHIAVVSVDGRQVTLSDTPSVTPVAAETVYAYGPTSDVLKKWRVKGVTVIEGDNGETLTHELQCEEYYDALYAADDWEPTEYSTGYTPPAVVRRSRNLVSREDIKESLPPEIVPAYMTPQATNLSFTGNDVDTVTWAKKDSTNPVVYLVEGVGHEITPDSTTDMYIYWTPNYPTLFCTTDDIAEVMAANGFVVCINDGGSPIVTYSMPILHVGILFAQALSAISANLGTVTAGTMTGVEFIASLGGDYRLRMGANGIDYSTNAGSNWSSIISVRDSTVKLVADIIETDMVGDGAIETDKVADGAIHSLDSESASGSVYPGNGTWADLLEIVVTAADSPYAHHTIKAVLKCNNYTYMSAINWRLIDDDFPTRPVLDSGSYTPSGTYETYYIEVTGISVPAAAEEKTYTVQGLTGAANKWPVTEREIVVVGHGDK